MYNRGQAETVIGPSDKFLSFGGQLRYGDFLGCVILCVAHLESAFESTTSVEMYPF